MKKTFFLAALLSLFTIQLSVSHAQNNNDPVIFEINGESIHKSEFMKEFLRSVGKDPKAAPTACTFEKRQALNDYVELFVNYRTKLADAYARGFDTASSLIGELNGYRKELAAPYLIDSVTMQNILREAYYRNQYALHCSHILIRCDQNAKEADTLRAYKKAMECYERVMKGEKFQHVALDASDDVQGRDQIKIDDRVVEFVGDVGTFSVFDMIYPFESAAYSLQVGEVSKPVRTVYGYHIIKLLDKIPYFGKTTFQHIFVSSEANPSLASARIMQANSRLAAGESFNTVCREFSDDKTTFGNGGLLSDLSVRQMPTQYVIALSGLKPGEISKPFATQYGWHIVKLVRHDSLPDFESMVPVYRQRMVRDDRSIKPRKAFVEQCKQRYHFVDYTKTMQQPEKGKKKSQKPLPMASLDESLAALSDSVFVKHWHYQEGMVTDLRPLFAIGDKQYTAVDFLKFIEDNQHFDTYCSLEEYMRGRYDIFINDKVFEYANSRLEIEHKEFAELMDEYRNGLMIFAYNDEMIWSKALHDTVGFDLFYKQFSQTRNIDNEDDANYFWNERARLTNVTMVDSSALAPKKAMKLMEKATKKHWTVGQLSDKMKDASKEPDKIVVESAMVEKGKQNLLSPSQWKQGIYSRKQGNGYQLVRVDELLAPCLKTRKEARGFYINEYQNFLEQELIKNLRNKYNVVIHQDVIDEITY